MTLLYSSPVFLQHETGSHPETAERLRRVTKHLVQTGLDGQCQHHEFSAVSMTRLSYVHSADYAAEFERFAQAGGGQFEADTVVSPRSYAVALQAAGAVCDAVEQVLCGNNKHAFCLTRPPGHHALPRAAMGFCLFNNVAIAARMAIKEFSLSRVMVVDWDVHHGNGTQDIFWEDPTVAYFSAHRHPFYPGTGTEDETGAGKGLGTKRNLAITFGTPRDQYMKRFKSELESFADKFKPELIMISAGFDAHRLDPIGSLGLEVEDYAELTRFVSGIANTHAAGRIVSLLEGGYNVDVLPLCVEAHVKELNAV